MLEISEVTKNFGGLRALNDISFQVDEKQIYGLIGPNGAGKTTLLRILTGQLEPSDGTAQVMGIALPDGAVEVRARVGVVPEFESPPSFLTGDEYLNFVCKARGIEDAAPRVDRWVEFFELGDHRHTLCKDMSKGMRQKVMLGAAFIHEPPLLFLDEPFINLDPLFQRKVQGYLRQFIADGGTIFMCSHLLEIAERLCSRLAIINEGSVVASGTLQDLMEEGEDGLGEVFMRLVGRKVEELERNGPERGTVKEV